VPQQLALELQQLLISAEGDLRALDSTGVGEPRSPGAWSKLQILGHLIDSAANNHQRFVRAQLSDELRFPPYDPPAWVSCQRYDSSDWRGLLELWLAYNRHLAHVLAAMSDQHLDTRVWVDWTGEQKAISLRSVIEEYFKHMRHHLEQLRG
jgi:hypothetical protein